MESLTIRRVPLASLIPDPANARAHGEKNLEAIRASLARFGQAEPLVIQRSTRRVIGGHGRLAAMKALGWSEADIVELDLDDLQATALGIALNRTGELAEWDLPALGKILESLQTQGALDGVGFSEKEIGGILDDVIAAAENLDGIVQDEAPLPPDAATTRAGDLWILGDHRLLCGDSSKRADLDRLLEGARIQLVNSDPPYNVKVEPRSNNAIAAGLSSFSGTTHHQSLDVARHPTKAKATHDKLRPKDRPLANDFVSDEEFDRLLRAWFGNLAYALEPGRAFYIWGGYGNLGNYPPALAESELYFSQGIVWNKLHPVLTRKDFMGAYELAFYGWREGAAHQFLGPNNATDLWEVKKVNPQSMVHLCLHPDALVLSESGWRPIRTLQVGERVFSGDGRFHAVEHVSTHEYTSERLYRITAKGGNEPTLASDNHPFLVWRPTRKGGAIVSAEVSWVRADELRVGDYTMTPALESNGPDPFPERDEEFWFLFGLYLAAGHIQTKGGGAPKYPRFSIHKKRQDLLDRIYKQWPGASEYDPNDYSPTPCSGLQVMVFDGDAGKEFERLGGRLGHEKRLAPEIFQLPREKRLAVLQGWLNGDGCRVRGRDYWQGNTVSPDLAAHLCLLADSVGYRTTPFGYDPPEELGSIRGRAFKSRRRVYYLYFYERRGRARRGAPDTIEHEGRPYSLRYVKSVEQVPYEGEVWNLSVEGHPSFQTAVGLSHNTEKPVELAARAMQYSSRPGENVLDLFGGSGSTLIGAEQTGRRAFLMELDPLYCDVIVERFEKLTGRSATLAGTNHTFSALRADRKSS